MNAMIFADAPIAVYGFLTYSASWVNSFSVISYTLASGASVIALAVTSFILLSTTPGNVNALTLAGTIQPTANTTVYTIGAVGVWYATVGASTYSVTLTFAQYSITAGLALTTNTVYTITLILSVTLASYGGSV